MKYGILGGSFDPPHLGHIEIARAAREHLELDEVIIIPNNRNPIKSRPMATAQQRMEMVKIAIDGEPGVALSDIEISRPGRSFAVDTLEELTMAMPGDYWFLMGADSLHTLPEWKEPDKLLKFCRIGVVERPGSDLDKEIGILPPHWRESIDRIPMSLKRGSSTQIRKMIADGESPEMWLDPDVYAYIQENNLYQPNE
ncbi:MAG: nicotinate-nucleotide adenylyltransferase [Armatimonadetes bacterium]|nr:nicotinate-nucleotide adenylyltransferase [Armatimonadota bacterium]